jgi:hypothetical protein
MTAPPIRRGWQLLTDAIGGIGVVVLVPTLLVGLVYVWLFVRSMVRQLSLPHLTALLLLWQAQTGAAFALAAALIGAIAIVRQTRATERRADERRERRATALRAVLPLMLSELIDYAKRCADIFAEVLAPRHGPSSVRVDELQRPIPWQWSEELPPLPAGFVGRLIDLIEAIPSDHARPLATLVRRMQHQHSRATDLRQAILSLSWLPHNRVNVNLAPVYTEDVLARLIDALVVHASCQVLLPYARGEIPAPPAAVSPDDVRRAAFLAARVSLLDEVTAEIDRYAATQASWPD